MKSPLTPLAINLRHFVADAARREPRRRRKDSPPTESNLFCSWMGSLVGLAEAGGADVGVNLRGDEAFVAEQFLHAADVGPAIQEMGGKAVPQGVRRRAAVEPSLPKVFFQQSSHAAGRQAAAELVDEDRGLRAGRL